MAARPHARRADVRLLSEAEDAHRSLRRYQARPAQPPVELMRPIEALGFVLAFLGVIVLVVLVLATGSQA